jgi:hypothetical protein
MTAFAAEFSVASYPLDAWLAYSPECVEKLFGNSQTRARRLTIKRIMAA